MGVTIGSEIQHPNDIINLLTQDSNNLLGPLKEQLQTPKSIIGVLVDLYNPTNAQMMLVNFLTKLGVKIRIVGTETHKQTYHECGHIAAQVILLLSRPKWWTISNDTFAKCASSDSITAVNEFLKRPKEDRKFMSGTEVLQFANAKSVHFSSRLGVHAIGSCDVLLNYSMS